MTNTELTKREDRSPMVILRDRLLSREAELHAALPSDIPVAAFVRAVMTSVQLNPDILACEWSTLWLACMRACRDGLLPDGVEGAIVPYKSTATFIPMYQGLLRRFRRSGQFKWITAGLVRKGEEFSHHIDENGEHFLHVPGDSFDAPIEKIYALATTKDGGVFATVLTMAEANKIRAMSKATRDDSPWKMWESEMLKKTALRRLAKVLPSARDQIAFDTDEIFDQGPIVEDRQHAIESKTNDDQAIDQPAPKKKTDAAVNKPG
jgi:recombination protein RecT